MKKTIFLMVPLLLWTMLSKGQFIYKDKFDEVDNYMNTTSDAGRTKIKSYKFSNHANWLADGESYVLRGYLAMYKATHDLGYLDKFVYHSKFVIQQRGEGRTDGKKCFTDSIGDTPGYASLLRNGMICYPLAEFSYLVNVEETSLGSLTMTYSVTYGASTYYTYNAYADFLTTYVEEVVDVFDEAYETYNDANNIDCWDSPGVNGYYRPVAQGSTLLENNIQCAMGLTLYKLYQITGTAAYLSKTKTIADRFSNMFSLVGNHYEWTHRWPSVTTCSGQSDWEDLDHGSIEIELAYECYKNGVKIGTDSIFTRTDIDRLARSLTESAYSTPAYLWFTVHGDNDWWPCDNHLESQFQLSAGRWLCLSEGNAGNIDYLGRDIFHIAAYKMYDRYDYAPNPTGLDLTYDPVTVMVNVANLCYYQSLGYARLNYYEQVKTYSSSSNWAGVAVGNFDGTDKQIVAVRNLDGDFYISKVSGGTITQQYTYTAPGSASQWAGVAAGNFDNTGKDEFIGVRNVDGDFFMYKYASGSVTTFKTYSEPSNSNWKGIAAGDFTGDGIDEFVAVRDLDSKVMLYNYDPTTTNITFKDDFIVSSATWGGVAAGDFDGDGIDEIAAINNGNRKIYIFNVNSSYIIQTPTVYTPPAGTYTWDAITAGNFGSGAEIIAHRQDNGDFYFFRLESGALVFKHHDYFTSGQLNNCIAAGRLNSASVDDFVYMRNLDGAMIVCSVDPITTANTTNQTWKLDDSPVTGIAQVLDQPLKIYPNPAGQQLTLEYTAATKGLLKIELVNVMGQKSTTLIDQQVEEGVGTYTFDISNKTLYKPGIYLVTCYHNSVKKHVSRLVIE